MPWPLKPLANSEHKTVSASSVNFEAKYSRTLPTFGSSTIRASIDDDYTNLLKAFSNQVIAGGQLRLSLTYLLLFSFPEEGLQELTEAMGEIHKFYEENANYRPSLPPQLSDVVATIIESSVRPTFILEPEE
jgi:hypothetical protein